MVHAALEKKVLVENSLHDGSSESDTYGRYQIIDINQVNLSKYIYAKPKLSMLIEHVITSKV
jgi:hypothetical protein